MGGGLGEQAEQKWENTLLKGLVRRENGNEEKEEIYIFIYLF